MYKFDSANYIDEVKELAVRMAYPNILQSSFETLAQFRERQRFKKT
jgi:hypothetical protein